MANTQFYSILILILNIYHLSNSQYIGLPKDKQGLSVGLNQKIELTCQYIGSDGNGSFSHWLKDNEVLDNNQTDRYEIITTQNETKLIIKYNHNDTNVSRWMVQTKKLISNFPSECQFGKISLKSLPQRIVTDKAVETDKEDGLTVRRIIKENVVLNCVIEPNLNTRIKLSRKLWDYSVDGTEFGKLPDGVRRFNRTQITIKNLKKTHQGHYRCSFNNQTVTAILRVKDPYAALWPFVAIVSTVLVLIVVILLFEKRQKDAKKKAAALTNDDANNPLVVSSKKTAEKADA